MQLWQGLALIIIVWTRTQMALSSDVLNLAVVVRMVIGLSIPLGMLRFYTAALPGRRYRAMEVEADPLDPRSHHRVLQGTVHPRVCGETLQGGAAVSPYSRCWFSVRVK